MYQNHKIDWIDSKHYVPLDMKKLGEGEDDS